MDIKIIPSILKGVILAPPSKSLTHRAIIAACMSEGACEIKNVIISDDIKATIGAMQALGFEIKTYKDYIIINGIVNGEKLVKKKISIDCRDSGSTLRFIIPIASLTGIETTFLGSESLSKRPLNVYSDIFNKQNLEYKAFEKELPLKIKGKLSAGEYYINGDISSQFITGLMYALPQLKGDSKIIMKSRLESKGYVNLTIDVLKKFNIEIENNNYKEFYIRGKQRFRPFDYIVEGDYSQIAFWLVAGLIGANINVFGMDLNSLQGDKEILNILKYMSGNIIENNQKITAKKSLTKGQVLDLSQCSDLGPIIFVLAALSEGQTQIINSSRLRLKESDRIASMSSQLNKMGANIIEKKDGAIITGVKNLKGGCEVSSCNDHRVAMALAIASIKCEKEIILKNAETVNKSYPNFWDDFENIGGNIKK